jgi:hypothetical protein
MHAAGIDNSTTTTQQDSGFDPTGWELALVTTSSNATPLSMESNLVRFLILH